MDKIDYTKKSLYEIPDRYRDKELASMSDTEIEELVDYIYKAGRSINLPIRITHETIAEFFKTFHCHQCGKCCVGGAEGIYLYPEDIERLSTGMRMSQSQFMRKFTSVSEGKRLLPLPCPFHNSDAHSCTVYQLRPQVCRLFPLSGSSHSIVAEHLPPSADRASIMVVNALCPEGRRIACQFLKMRRNVKAV